MKDIIIKITLAAGLAALLQGCCLFKKYSDNTEVSDNLFEAVTEGPSIGELSWRELFSDTLLCGLIDSALANNTDLKVAELRVREADASLKSARLGYLPTLGISPSFNITPGQYYTAPINAEWGVQGFGSITNRLREAKVLALQATDNEKTVRSRLIAQVAQAYCHLLLLDRQKSIMQTTEKVWGDLLETQKALMENGRAYSTSVNQMKASLLGVQIQLKDLSKNIQEVEGAICLLLGSAPRTIERAGWKDFRLPEKLSTGVPALLLDNRPDVKAAGHAVEAAYYVTNQARAAMFPSLNISGMLGWTSQGVALKDPASMIYSAVASLTLPIFAQGRLRANLKVSKYRQEEAARQYTQTILEAGDQVRTALRDCQTARDKDVIYKEQVATLLDAYDATVELMLCGKAMYIEVLTAENALLESQLNEAINLYEGHVGIINLYVALGGGTK